MPIRRLESSIYQSYLLRIWRDHSRAAWRASLQSTATEQIHPFGDVDQMWAFLKVQMDIDAGDPGAGAAPDNLSE